MRYMGFASRAIAVLLGSITSAAAGTASPPMKEEGAPEYQIDLSFSLDVAKVRAQGVLILPPALEEKKHWQFLLSEKMHAVSPVRVACGERRSRVTKLEIVGESEYGDSIWQVSTATPCAAGKQVKLLWAYESDGSSAPQLRIDKQRGFGGSSGRLWYPRVSRTTLHTGQISLLLPGTLKGIATGRLVKKTKVGGQNKLVFKLDTPGKFAFAYAAYQEVGFSAPFPLRVLTTKSADVAESIGAGFTSSIRPLLATFGSYPKPSLTIVEIDFQSQLLGIGEFGMTFADVSLFKSDFDVPYWAHEFSHEWWGNYVHSDPDTPGATMFTEGLAQYGAIVALEASKGAQAAAEYRLAGARNSSLTTYSELAAKGSERPLVGPPPQGQDEILLEHRLATSKGAILLDQFSRMIGRERFHALLRSFLLAHAGEKASWQSFEDHLNAGTTNAYKWWFDQWMRRPGAPDLWARSRVEGRHVRLELGQRGELYRLIVPIEVRGAWGRARFNIETSGAVARKDFDAPGPITDVLIDPDSLVPRKYVSVLRS